jgi:hypothetical protein
VSARDANANSHHHTDTDANPDVHANAYSDSNAATMREYILADLQRHVPRRRAVFCGWAVCALPVR